MDKLPKFIGLRGAIGAGKDTAAAYLCYHFAYTVLGFSDPVYESVYRLNPAIVVAHHKAEYLQTIVDKLGWDTAKRRYPAIRAMLQVTGTENGREVFGPDCWVDVAKRRVRQHGFPDNPGKRFVFRDVRFGNEADWIYEQGGEIWDIVGRTSEEVSILKPHTSEQQTFKVTRTVLNDGTIPQFHKRINEIIKGFLGE